MPPRRYRQPTHRHSVENLSDAIGFLKGEKEIEPLVRDQPTLQDFPLTLRMSRPENVKRAPEVAAAGGNAILIGPPGAGKTMLAKRMPTIYSRPSTKH